MNEMPIVDRLERLMYDLRLEYQEYIELREIRYEVERLQNENATLREKFATLNKMPCNIGDTVNVLFGSCYRCEDDEGDHCSCEKRGKDKIFEMKVGSVRFDKDDYYLYEDPIGISSGLSCSGRNYGKTWFLSLEEAKNHLMIS